MQIQYRDASGQIQLVRAGFALAANPFPLEYSSPYVTAVGLAANTSVNHTTPHNPTNQQYNSIELGLYVDLPAGVRARRVYAEWDANASTSSEHWYGVYAGVWDTGASIFVSPLKPVLASRRSNQPGCGHEVALFPMYAFLGNGVGQIVMSHAYAEATVVIPQAWYDLLASNPELSLRFVMALRNNTASAITEPWRAMLTVFCF